MNQCTFSISRVAYSHMFVCFRQRSKHSEVSDKGYHALKAGLALPHLESLRNLTAYLLPKNSAGVSFGRLLLRGPTVTSGHPTMHDLIIGTTAMSKD